MLQNSISKETYRKCRLFLIQVIRDLGYFDWRAPTIISLVCVTAAALSLRLIAPPLGPGLVVYSRYAPFWVLVGAALVCAIIAVRWLSVPWWTVTLVALLSTVALVALSVVWDVPYGPHDSWTHLAQIHAEDLNPASNVYPLLHAGVLTSMVIFDLPAEPILTRVVALSAGMGVLFLVIVARRFPADRTARQTAVLVAAPAVCLGFVTRPYTVAMTFVLLFYWFVFTILTRGQSPISRVSKGILTVLFAGLVFFHPLTTLVITIIGATGYFVVRWLPRVPLSIQITAPSTAGLPTVVGNSGHDTKNDSGREDTDDVRYPSSISIDPVVVLLLVLPLAAHFLLVAAVGERVAGAVILAILADVQVSRGHAGDVGVIAAAFASVDNTVEFFMRSSYAFGFTIAALLALAHDFSRRRMRAELAITLLAGGGILVFFVGINVVSSKGIGLYRLFSLAPIVAFPAAIGVLRARNTTWRQVGTVVLAIGIVTAGLLTAFPSPFIGAAAQSGNEQQAEGIRWLVSHNPPQVVGTRMTFWVMRGLYGTATTQRLSPTEARGGIITLGRTANYSWGATSRPAGALYVVDAASSQSARHLAVEEDPTALRCLQTFQRVQSRVYQNGDTSAYVLSTPREPQCTPV